MTQPSRLLKGKKAPINFSNDDDSGKEFSALKIKPRYKMFSWGFIKSQTMIDDKKLK
jgi:hypothetical protein